VQDRAVTVIDAKYKLQDAGHTNPDHFQILSYCTALGVRTGCLVYAHGPAGPQRLRIQSSPIDIIRYPLDLDAPPSSILKQIADLADQIDAAERGRA
jgi:5-methylcytosine-specific restriction enzyme subunit McrC